MDKYTLMSKLASAETDLLKVVSKLSDIEREIQREEESTIKLSSFDIGQLEDGFTITVLHEGRALRLRMKSMVEAV